MIYQKLEILKNANVISQKSYDFMLKVHDLFKEKNININNAEVFITHLAMATERCYKFESIEPVSDLVYGDLKIQNSYDDCLLLWEDIKNISEVKFSSAEEGYIFIHMCSLLAGGLHVSKESN